VRARVAFSRALLVDHCDESARAQIRLARPPAEEASVLRPVVFVAEGYRLQTLAERAREPRERMRLARLAVAQVQAAVGLEPSIRSAVLLEDEQQPAREWAGEGTVEEQIVQEGEEQAIVQEEEQQTEEEGELGRRCALCMTRPGRLVFWPCGHLCSCEQCFQRLMRTEEERECISLLLLGFLNVFIINSW